MKTDTQLTKELSNAWESSLNEARRKAAQADKLAEALRGIVAALTQKVQWSDGKGGAIQIIQGDCAVARNMARSALAEYEAAQ